MRIQIVIEVNVSATTKVIDVAALRDAAAKSVASALADHTYEGCDLNGATVRLPPAERQ